MGGLRGARARGRPARPAGARGRRRDGPARDRARDTAHSTAAEAAAIAREAEVGLLALTHLSNRYFGPEIAREARAVFPDTVVPKDFDAIEVPFAERGSPHLVKGAVLPPGARDRMITGAVTRMVQLAVAGDVSEAEELQTILRTAGIDAELEPAVEHHPRSVEDMPQKILVPESSLEAAQEAIEAMTEPDDLLADA